MARTGMSTLITRLRALTNDEWQRRQDKATGDGSTSTYWLNYKPLASGGTISLGGTVQGTANYTLDLTYGRLEFDTSPANSVAIIAEYMASEFSDDDMQTFLDSQVTPVRSELLRWLPETVGGGTIEYYDAQSSLRDMEEAAGGTARWVIRDSVGTVQGTAGYTPNYQSGIIRFSADQGGSAYYLTGYSYDLYEAAADVWLRRASKMSDWYQIEGDGQRFARQQAFEHAKAMAETMRRQGGQNRQQGKVGVGLFASVDFNRSQTMSEWGNDN